MNLQNLMDTAKKMVSTGKGVLAIDESHGTCAKRFEAIGVECTEDTRRAYRGLLVSAPGLEEAVSGMILYDETLRQADDAGVPFSKLLSLAMILETSTLSVISFGLLYPEKVSPSLSKLSFISS